MPVLSSTTETTPPSVTHAAKPTAPTDAAAKAARMEGHQKRIPAHLVKAHVDRLRAAGMTIPSIAAQAGIAKNTVDNIAHDRRSFTTRATATAIAQLVPANQTPDRIPAWRVQRRLQALYALGWTVAEIARHTDWMDRNVNALMYPRWRRRETVDYATFTTFDRVFRDLCMKIPPRSAGSVVAVRRAAERGWVVPLGWDDIDRDVRPPRVPRDSGQGDRRSHRPACRQRRTQATAAHPRRSG